MPVNPYLRRERWTLRHECQARAAELGRRGVARTAAEREELASDTVMLLMAVADQLADGPSFEWTPGTPEFHAAAGRVELLMAWCRERENNIRRALVRRVLELGGMDAAASGRWMMQPIEGKTPFWTCAADEEGLQWVLERALAAQPAVK